MPSPLTPQHLIIESLDLSQPSWAREPDDVPPLLATFQDVGGESVELPPSSSVLEDLPHIEKSIYILCGMSIPQFGHCAVGPGLA